ncbi:predicted dioxygenase, partial [sediment metagenome]
ISHLFTGKPGAKIVACGIILPHAGYIYSGKVAATTINKIFLKKILSSWGNNHTSRGADFALWNEGEWQTPLGNIAVNSEIITAILQSGTTILADTLAHTMEHSIEVELPILQQTGGGFSIIPITCKPSIAAKYEAAAGQICTAIKNRTDILFIASTDMTHYEPDAKARKKDSLAIERIVALDPEGFLNIVKKNIFRCAAPPRSRYFCTV